MGQRSNEPGGQNGARLCRAGAGSPFVDSRDGFQSAHSRHAHDAGDRVVDGWREAVSDDVDVGLCGPRVAPRRGGTYGVLSYSVACSTRDIGLRMALGALRTDVIRWVFSHGMQPVLVGLFAGLVGAVAVARALRSLLFEGRANRSARARRRLTRAVAHVGTRLLSACPQSREGGSRGGAQVRIDSLSPRSEPDTASFGVLAFLDQRCASVHTGGLATVAPWPISERRIASPRSVHCASRERGDSHRQGWTVCFLGARSLTSDG